MESKVINHFNHEHPLILTKYVCGDKGGTNCYACGTPVGNLEMAYVCMQKDCSSSIIFHNKCGDLPLQISHPKHIHPMKLIDFHYELNDWCDQCGRDIGEELGYECHDCEFKIDTRCVEALLEGRQELQHPCHPGHTLTLMRKAAFAFRCDGCGAEDVDMAYICSSCEFWVHRSCALLPAILSTNHHHHHHPLSLIIPLSKEYCSYRYRCDVCDKFFDKSCWVYSCGDCRYFVHLKCVGSTTQSDSIVNEDEDDVGGANVIQFPLDANEISNKVITPFVMRETGGVDQTNSLLFNYHNHPLSLVSSFTSNEDEGDDDDDDGDDDDDDDEDREVKVCDVCVSPISSPPYYQCSIDACTYFIHSICSLLPNTLHSSSPDLLKLYGDCQGIPNKNHNFTLYKPKHMEAISFWFCNLCTLPTNGMGYECGECEMKIDVKCASRPTIIKYSSYPPHHKPLILTRLDEATSKKKKKKKCYLCRTTFTIGTVYCCISEKCDFVLHWECALLPRSITGRDWDNKHPLLLMYDAFIDHPSDFYCEFCEEKMHPKNWKYHCRQCDITYHRNCLDTESGRYRNIKFGRRFELGDRIHPHSLTLKYVTLKKFCDLCHRDIYTYVGLECAACYYVLCISCCNQELYRCK